MSKPQLTLKGQKTELQKENNKVERIIFLDFNYAKGVLKGIADVRGEKCYMIDYKEQKVYYSISTGLRKVIIDIEKQENGKDKILKRSYTSDYRDVNGLKFPFKLRQTRPGLRNVKFDVVEISVNKGVSDKDFKF